MNPFAHKSADELAQMWQLRSLHASHKLDPLHRVIFAAFLEEYSGVTPGTWSVIYRGLFGNHDIAWPIKGYAKIMQSGRVVAMVVDRLQGARLSEIYRNKDEFISDLRRFADKLKLSDADRVAFFAVLGGWIVADLRVDVHGEKRLAS